MVLPIIILFQCIRLLFMPIFSNSHQELKTNGIRTNLNECKISQLGREYRGKIYTTASGIRCKPWHDESFSQQQIDRLLHAAIRDEDFPDKSIRLAKNYCRNPTIDPRGPWCYTMDPNVIDDQCEIPLCNFGECRITGPGNEYGGTRAISSSGRKCKSWNKRHKTVGGKSEKFADSSFPELSKGRAKNYCRNPNDDSGGPWCYVEEENYELVEKEYCDIQFCDDRDCLVYSQNASTYSMITSMNNYNDTKGSMTIFLKLWNPVDEIKGEAKILLSLLPIPTSSKFIADEWRSGCELLISNSGSGQIYPHAEEEENNLEPTPNILVSSNWTELNINWGSGFVSVSLGGSTKPIFLDQYSKKETIANLYDNQFFYYGLMGSGILWSTDKCLDSCEIHTTFGTDFIRLWPLRRANTSYEIIFYIRANKKAMMRLYQSPDKLYPSFTISIESDKIINLSFRSSATGAKEDLKQIFSTDLIDFWSWKGFTLSIFGPHLRLFSEKHYGNEEILYFKQHFISTMRWFSFGSDNIIAHWSLFCNPKDENSVEVSSPPNCLTTLSDYSYYGSQWFNANNEPCIPWYSQNIPDNERKDDLFPPDDGSFINAMNKCRNPSHDPEGPYCYTMELKKTYCNIRRCRSLECRTAGTANDYIGNLSITRSGRTCAPWLTKHYDNDNESQMTIGVTNPIQVITTATPKTSRLDKLRKNKNKWRGSDILSFNPHNKRSHFQSNSTGLVDLKGNPDNKKIDINKYVDAFFGKNKKERTNDDKEGGGDLTAADENTRTHKNTAYLNDSLYPEQSVRKASNYCRDPSKNIAGTWCYTTDPLVPQDLCDVPDCDKSDECISLVRGQETGRKFFILPQHRSEGLYFSLKAWEPDNPDSITFTFTPDGTLTTRYILKIGAMNNEKVLLYYQAEQGGGLELVKEKSLPHLLYLGKWSSFLIKVPRGKIQLYYEGAPNPLFEWQHSNPLKSFLPIYYYYATCQIEHTQTERFTRIIPIPSTLQRIQLMIRAEGVVLLPLLLFPAIPGYYALTFGEMDQWIFFIKNTYPNVQIFHKQKIPSTRIFSNDTWTNITITWYKSTISVFWNESLVFNYVHNHPLLFYFFSLAVDKGGSAIWTVDCLPSDIDGDPVDGGWSEWGPWACSASCNGGVGSRKRLCNNPEPNIKGEPCMGASLMTGRCNTIQCGDITEDTANLIRRRIRRNYTSIMINEKENIIIPGDTDIIEIINQEVPDGDISWSHNGIMINFSDNDRIQLIDYAIVIRNSEVNDSGVYTMTLHRVDGRHMILKLVSLSVLPVKTILTRRETMPMTLVCHCLVLGYLYNDLKISWKINNRIWKDYGLTQPISVNVDHIESLNSSHRGLWQCVVRQDDLSFSWTTNAMFINVISPPNWKTHLMEDDLTKPIFSWMPTELFVTASVFIIFLFVTGFIIVGFIVYIKFRDGESSIAVDRKTQRRT